MDGLNNMNQAIEYIEANLMYTIDIKTAAKKAYMSEYQFSRMFTQLFDISLSEYIRRRRLTLAAFDIQNSDIKVMDLSLKYGYESVDAFSRAFKKLHHLTPTEARNPGSHVVAFPRISISVHIVGETGIHYRVETTDKDISVFGRGFIISEEKQLEEIPKAWKTLVEIGELEVLGKQMDKKSIMLHGILGIYGGRASETRDEYKYFIGVKVDEGISLPFDLIKIGKGRWIVFTNLTDARRKLFSEWIPTLGYTLDDRPYIECIFSPFDPTKNELWVPIK